METFFAIDIGENLLQDFFVERFRHVCKNCLLGIEGNVSKKNLVPKWCFLIFALTFSDFEQNCFWLPAEKLRHSRQNCSQVYVARFRRKRLFRKYSTFHIDVGFWPNFFSFRWQLFGRGIEKAFKGPEQPVWNENLIWEEF